MTILQPESRLVPKGNGGSFYTKMAGFVPDGYRFCYNFRMKKVLGVDVGGVIVDYARAAKDRKDQMSKEEFLLIPEIEGAIDTLARLNQGVFKDSVYLVSKHSGSPEDVQEWLINHNFYQRTGISRDHLYQCATREGKAPIVQKLNITHFIDDRAEVMSHFADFVPNLYHFQSILEDRNEWATKIPVLAYVENWKDLEEKLLAT